MRPRTASLGGRRAIAIGGKTVRGARIGSGRAPHLVAALDHGLGAVIAVKVQLDAKSSEIPALREVLEPFDPTGVVVTAVALHTQKDTANYITDRGGDYVLTVKANQPSLFKRRKAMPGPNPRIQHR